jgi:uncharacterized Zn finger protein (UPF0148 family)
MFCPKCGDTLIRQDGDLTCIQGQMSLSCTVEKVLTERFAADALPQAPEPLFQAQLHSGLAWFCPGCGAPLNTYLECGSCNNHLRDLVGRLVELHPHQ